MSHDIAMLRAKLRRSLEHIGKANGHACPPTTSNVDPVLHELYLAAEGEAYFTARHKAAKQAAFETVLEPERLDAAVTRVTQNMQGETLLAASGDLYAMTITLTKPATRLDQTALRNYLRVECGLDPAVIDKAFEASSTLNAPAKRVKVAGR